MSRIRKQMSTEYNIYFDKWNQETEITISQFGPITVAQVVQPHPSNIIL